MPANKASLEPPLDWKKATRRPANLVLGAKLSHEGSIKLHRFTRLHQPGNSHHRLPLAIHKLNNVSHVRQASAKASQPFPECVPADLLGALVCEGEVCDEDLHELVPVRILATQPMVKHREALDAAIVRTVDRVAILAPTPSIVG